MLMVAGCGSGTAVQAPDAGPALTGSVRAVSTVGLQAPYHLVSASFTVGAGSCRSFTVSGCRVTRCPAAAARAPQAVDGGTGSPPDAATPPAADAAPGLPDASLPVVADASPVVVDAAPGGEPDAAPGDAGPEVAANAGALSLRGGRRLVTLVPAADGSYPDESSTADPLWAGGESLTVDAAGADVPGFSARLTAPRPVVVLQPALGAGELFFDRDTDLGLVWAAGEPGFTVAGELKTTTLAISCAFPAEAGQGLIAAGALRELPLTGGATFTVTVEDRETQTVGSWRLDLSAASVAALPDGSAAMLPARFD